MAAENETSDLISNANVVSPNQAGAGNLVFIEEFPFMPNADYQHYRTREELAAHFRMLIVEACQKSGWEVVDDPACGNRISGMLGDVAHGELSKILGRPRGYVRFHFKGEVTVAGRGTRKIEIRVNFDLAWHMVSGIGHGGIRELDLRMNFAASKIATGLCFLGQKTYQTSNSIVGLYLALSFVVLATAGAAVFVLIPYLVSNGIAGFGNIDSREVNFVSIFMGIGSSVIAFFLTWSIAPSSILASNAMVSIIRNSGTKSVFGLRVLFAFFAFAISCLCAMFIVSY